MMYQEMDYIHGSHTFDQQIEETSIQEYNIGCNKNINFKNK